MLLSAPGLDQCRRFSAPEPWPMTLFALAVTSSGFAVSVLPVKLPAAEGWTSQCQSTVQEQDTAVLFLPLTVLKIALLLEPWWCPLKGVSDFFICPEEWSKST